MRYFALFTLATLAIAAPIEQRGAPSKGGAAPAPSSGGAHSDCYNNGCGGNYPWKKDIEDEVLVERAPEPEPQPEPIVEVEALEERGGPSKGSPTTSSASSGATDACYNNGCGGNYPWKKDVEDEVLVERAPEPEPEPQPIVEVEALEERGGPSKGSATTSSASSGATDACYNNGCGGNYPW